LRKFLLGVLLSSLPLTAVTAQNSNRKTGWQCVPYARMISGIQIFGNASTWWRQAAGRYLRSQTPQVGAVLAFAGTRAMPGGHVAKVSELVDARTIRITHANWSPINGRRGQIEKNVLAIDTSANNDWTRVRVWYAPIRAVGLRHSPTYGFILPGKAKPASDPVELALRDFTK
jgi:surface antigen